jgi:hypothetical protein
MAHHPKRRQVVVDGVDGDAFVLCTFCTYAAIAVANAISSQCNQDVNTSRKSV